MSILAVSMLAAQSAASAVIVSEDFASGDLSANAWATASDTGSGRIEVTDYDIGFGTGNDALYMDVMTAGSNQNRADLTFSLSGFSNAYLSFDMMHFSEETTAPDFQSATGDGVGLSFDGVNFVTLQDGNSAPGGGAMTARQVYSFNFDLAQIASDNGYVFGATTILRLLQFDNSQISIDGRGYDNTLVVDSLAAPVPIPASVPLLAAGLGLLGVLGRGRRS